MINRARRVNLCVVLAFGLGLAACAGSTPAVRGPTDPAGGGSPGSDGDGGPPVRIIRPAGDGMCATPLDARVSPGAKVQVCPGCAETCTCERGELSCPRPIAPPRVASGRCLVAGVSFPAGASFPAPDACNSASCRPDGTVVTTLMACAPAAVARTVTLEPVRPSPITAELLVLDVRRVAAPAPGLLAKADEPAPMRGGMRLRLANPGEVPIKVFVDGDGLRWSFAMTTTTGPRAEKREVAGDCTERYVQGSWVELGPRGAVEIPIAYLVDRDRCRPTRHYLTAPGEYRLAVDLAVNVIAGGMEAERVDLRGEAPLTVAPAP